jgi:hypothetical protein
MDTEEYTGTVRYARETSHWEPWQLEYRLGLILIVPPREIVELIDPLRERYDPKSQAICSTHISLSEPLTKAFTPALEDELLRILAQVAPFEMRFTALYASRQFPGVAYRIEPEDKFYELRHAVHSSTAFEGSEFGRKHRPPHMTIAEFISIEDGLLLRDQLAESAPVGAFTCDRLELIVPDDSFHFQRIRQFPLGKR